MFNGVVDGVQHLGDGLLLGGGRKREAIGADVGGSDCGIGLACSGPFEMSGEIVCHDVMEYQGSIGCG